MLRNTKILAYTFVELLLSFCLGIMLLTAMIHFFIYSVKIYHQQQLKQQLLGEANILSHDWESTFSNMGDGGCGKPINYASINNLTDYPLLTSQGLQLLPANSMNLPLLFPRADRKKLLANSFIVVVEGPAGSYDNAIYDAQQKALLTAQPTLIKDDIALLTNCQQNLLVPIKNIRQRGQQKEIVIDLSERHAELKNNIERAAGVKLLNEKGNKLSFYLIAPWKITFWYIMRNSHHTYSLYKIQFPHDTTPVELIANIKNITARVYQNGQWLNEASITHWEDIQALRFNVVLEKENQTLNWPIGIVFCGYNFSMSCV